MPGSSRTRSCRAWSRGLQLFVVLVVLLVTVGTALAGEPGESSSGSDAKKWGDIGLSVLGGLTQLILGIALAVTSITLGLRVIGRTLPDVKILDELRNKNIGVGLMTAGVVIAYTKVISTGIKQIGDSISVAPGIGSFVGGVVNLVIGLTVASIGVTWAFKALSKVAPGIKLAEELNKGNAAVGLFVAGVLYGISEMIAAAVQGIGPGLAGALSRLI
jgi:uncharacterized membrane protein YjfL (UPF0719 family)